MLGYLGSRGGSGCLSEGWKLNI